MPKHISRWNEALGAKFTFSKSFFRLIRSPFMFSLTSGRGVACVGKGNIPTKEESYFFQQGPVECQHLAN